jgi:hypothetical protein
MLDIVESVIRPAMDFLSLLVCSSKESLRMRFIDNYLYPIYFNRLRESLFSGGPTRIPPGLGLVFRETL